jgi:hypothetical protein
MPNLVIKLSNRYAQALIRRCRYLLRAAMLHSSRGSLSFNSSVTLTPNARSFPHGPRANSRSLIPTNVESSHSAFRPQSSIRKRCVYLCFVHLQEQGLQWRQLRQYAALQLASPVAVTVWRVVSVCLQVPHQQAYLVQHSRPLRDASPHRTSLCPPCRLR